MSKRHVLIVEDEPKIAELIADYFKQDGFEVTHLDAGDNAVEFIRNTSLAGVILDRMLPGKDGLTICQETRKFSSVPIIMVTARVDEIDRLIGLECGADDYVCKPFSPRELVTRLKVILRRVEASGLAVTSTEGSTESNSIAGDIVDVDMDSKHHYGSICIDAERFECLVNGQGIKLTAVEFRLLQCLMSRPGRVFAREELMTASYPDKRIVSDRTVDSHIKKLRKKLMAASVDEGGQATIHSLYGVGYKIE